MTQASSNEHAARTAPAGSSLLASLRAKLDTPSAPLVLGALALTMSLPSLGFGLMTDDHMHADSFRHGLGPLEMLQLPAAGLQRMLQNGEFTWWTSHELTIRFLRPLSSLTHWVEFTLWPNAVWAMHLTNVSCYALLVAIAALTYRELIGNGRIAGLAALMFAMDDRHAFSVGWISSRNTLLAALFAQLAILLHVRGRKLELWSLVIASAVSSALAMLSAEYGVAVFAYVFAYAWLLDSGSLAARARSLAPQVLVGLIWVAVYTTGHYGLKHSGWYRDPSAQPVETLVQGLLDLPVWCFSQFGLNVAELAVLQDASIGRTVTALLVAPILLWLSPSLRDSRVARFFAAGMAFALVPVFTTHPQRRLLLLPGFGGLGWLACALAASAGSPRIFERAGARVMRVCHLWLAPLIFMVMLGSLLGVDRAAHALADQLPKQGRREAVLINTPLELIGQTATMIRGERGAPELASLHQLYAGDSEVEVRRIDARTLDIATASGWGRLPFYRLFTRAEAMPKLNESRSMHNLVATVLEVTADGRPSRVRFLFATPLESAEHTWLVWRGARPEPFQLPPIGGSVTVPGVAVFDLPPTKPET